MRPHLSYSRQNLLYREVKSPLMLCPQLFDIFKRRINAVILEPKELVTVLRIIERQVDNESYQATANNLNA